MTPDHNSVRSVIGVWQASLENIEKAKRSARKKRFRIVVERKDKKVSRNKNTVKQIEVKPFEKQKTLEEIEKDRFDRYLQKVKKI